MLSNAPQMFRSLCCHYRWSFTFFKGETGIINRLQTSLYQLVRWL